MTQTEAMREKTFNMRMSPEEWARLEGLAAHHEMAAAAVVRMLIKREAAAVHAELVEPYELKDGRALIPINKRERAVMNGEDLDDFIEHAKGTPNFPSEIVRRLETARTKLGGSPATPTKMPRAKSTKKR